MVVVRESPRAQVSPDKSSSAWPPKSPFQALVSSPSGRKKWQDGRNRDRDRSVSPSPLKKAQSSSKALQSVSMSDDDEQDGDEEDEDEETLQLRLEAIQAKLKLKKLQQKSKKDAIEGSEKENSARTSSRAESPPASPSKSARPPISRPRPQRDDVQVPLSPTKERIADPQEQMSPARKRLGLTTDLKARDVSLKRARDGTQVKQADSLRRAENEAATPKLSFSERLNRSRVESHDQRSKQERIEKARSKGFGDKVLNEASQLSGRATPGKAVEAKRPSSAHQMQSPSKLERETNVARSQSTRTYRSERSNIPRAQGLFTSRDDGGNHAASTSSTSTIPTEDPEKQSAPFDPFSQIHLSKRHIPHVDVARAMEDNEIYTLPRLLKEVKAPHYDPPDCESDFVLFAILASKSSPFDQKAAHRTSDENKPQEDAEAPRNKFMVLHLCDLKWEVDCFLFGTAFTQFWKLTPGTLLAILNPGIMPPKQNQNSGRFSLKLGSSEDCVMEIGLARDLGYCTSVKKDGQQCGAWVDKRSTEVCEFHLNLEIDRNRKHRMEVNTMWRSHNNDLTEKGRSGGEYRGPKSKGGEKGSWDNATGGGKKKNSNGSYHREYGQLYSMPSGVAKSAANLLDADDTDALHGMSREEASRKRIADAQRERDLAKKLGEMGKGVGAEYLRVKQTSSTESTTKQGAASTTTSSYFEKPSASDLGLLGKKATEQRLSPSKDRKRHFGTGAISSSTGGAEAMGWGGARKAGLLQQPKETPRLGSPEKGQTRLDARRGTGRAGIVRGRSEEGSLSPKKRARFALEKGIREPGRESLGEELRKGQEGEDEDELDIV